MSKLPEILQSGKFDREKAASLLWDIEYGAPLPMPDKIEFESTFYEDTFCASRAIFEKINVILTVGEKQAQFPITVCRPSAPGKYPAIVHINFRSDVPDRYLPAEEMLDRGVAFANIFFKDVATDDDDFTNGITPLFDIDRSKKTATGKIMIWALAARCVATYFERTDYADMANLAVAGHSRLGKTALVAGALDDRFKFVYSNDSGCSGAALFRDKVGERISDITRVFPYWFCPGFAEWADREDDLPFDQHFLLAMSSDRNVYVASAELDSWADPDAEHRCCVAASPAFELTGKGFIDEPYSSLPVVFHKGNIGSHIRTGSHFLSREDWNFFIDYMQEHKNA